MEPVENNQKTDINLDYQRSNVLDDEQPTKLSPEEWQRVVNEDGPEWTPVGTNVAHAVDNLTHVIAKLLQTNMEIAHHLEVISKAIDRVAR